MRNKCWEAKQRTSIRHIIITPQCFVVNTAVLPCIYCSVYALTLRCFFINTVAAGNKALNANHDEIENVISL